MGLIYVMRHGFHFPLPTKGVALKTYPLKGLLSNHPNLTVINKFKIFDLDLGVNLARNNYPHALNHSQHLHGPLW